MPTNQELRSRSNKKTSKGAKKAEAAKPSLASAGNPNVQAARAARDLLTEAGTFSFSFNSAFRILLIARITSALFGVIQDCDEVFNYWEPLHYLQHGTGMETWEYSPEFGIRSWAYILVHSIVATAVSILATHKMQVFYLLRLAFAAISAFVEARFYRTVTEEINPHVGRYVFVGLFFSAGMFNASTAFLPSSFAMWTTFLAFSYALRPPNQITSKRTYRVVLCIGLGALIGWPFSAAISIPFVVDEIMVYGHDGAVDRQGRVVQIIRPPNWRLQRVIRLAKAVAVCAAGISVPVVLVDYFFYRRLMFVPLNIVLYNVFGGANQGPDIFGTEPWYYYIVNGFLSYNILFLLALASAPFAAIAAFVDRERVPGSTTMDKMWPYIQLGTKLLPFYIWFTIFTLQPHKEERFLYVAYPFIVLNAAISLFLARGWVSRTARAFGASVLVRANIVRYLAFAVLAVYSVISVSRIIAVTTRYRAPAQVYSTLWQERPADQLINLNYLQENYLNDATVGEINLCVGKEWYRFPGSYFLPSDMRLQFIKSDFDGMLPKHFVPDVKTVTYEENGEVMTYRGREYSFKGARTVQPGFNSYNKADSDAYFDLDKCDYLVDADYPLRPISTREPRYIQDEKTWEVVDCAPMLDAVNSNQLSRAFYVPGSKGLVWADYCLLKRRRS
ncbi:Alg9-like mannosyltransferase family-domain-containing protein [Zychaea mexicana]|uniref:Alg9-like mannosyltransferase family-domain-containing protein n=1 Tax=Zychaea mexicana TaxID=64656 RepID=UPI0022FE60CE|nr:Alg9-like mannosyltransferase family-domain-containing protein [Zychaea mexicana]KAI9484605.1 Alg9-like mannosyltransferase family-domain-containing protein [Zychaea mexicana]